MQPTTTQASVEDAPLQVNTIESERIFDLQRANRQALKDTTANARIQKLKSLRAVLLNHRQAIQDALYADFRKAPEEVDLTETFIVSSEISHAIKHLKKWMKPKKAPTPLTLVGTSSKVHYEPKGVGLIISPWNYPLNLTMGPLIGAISAGCPAIIKPSEFTPHTSRLMKSMLAEVFEEDEVAIFEGDYTISQALLALPFDHIYFTGSPAVGKIVMRAASEHLSSITLELGGKSPTIVDATADIEDAADKILFGKFSNTGQTCIAPDYVYVHKRIYDTFVETLHAKIKVAFGSNLEARVATSAYARIVNNKHFLRVQQLYEDALSMGAKRVVGASSDDSERFIDPTLLTDVPLDSTIMQEEIFGPVLPILTFQKIEEVLETINSRPKPLTLYIFSKHQPTIDWVLSHTTAGSTCINDTLLHFMHPELPFGGVNASGIGKGHGYYSFLAFTNERPVLRQHMKSSLFKKFYPPYTDTTRKLINLLMKYF